LISSKYFLIDIFSSKTIYINHIFLKATKIVLLNFLQIKIMSFYAINMTF